MERVTTKEAAKLLNMDVVTLQFLMRQERLPIGYAIKKDGKSRYHYIIYRSMLDAFIQEIPVIRLRCRPDLEAVTVLEKAIEELQGLDG